MKCSHLFKGISSPMLVALGADAELCRCVYCGKEATIAETKEVYEERQRKLREYKQCMKDT